MTESNPKASIHWETKTAGSKGKEGPLPGTPLLRSYRPRPFCIFQLILGKRGVNSIVSRDKTSNPNEKI